MLRFHFDKPYPSYSISNSGQNLRTAKMRLEKLIKQSKEITKKEVFDKVILIDNVEDNRCQIFFDSKPNTEIRTKLKRHAFRWSPSLSCWQSYRNNYSVSYAKEIINLLQVFNIPTHKFKSINKWDFFLILI